MGGIFAKLDNQDKIISLERKSMSNVKDEFVLSMDKLKEYYNKHGYLKVEINAKDMKTYVESYAKKYLKKSEKEISNMTALIGMQFSMSMILSNYGLFAIYEKQVEKFTIFEAFENDHYGGYETLINVGNGANQQQGLFAGSAVQQSAQQAQQAAQQSAQQAQQAVQQAQQAAKPSQELMTILIPKIYFTEERNDFIDFLIAGLPKKGDNLKQQKQILLFAKKILDKINQTPNPEVKIANTIGLLTRINMLQFALNLVKTKYSQDESLDIISDLINEHLDDIPNDKCVFYNDKLNFIKFTPNICAIASEEQESRLKKLYEGKCPVQEERVCPVQEERACPVQETPKCPVQEQVSCPKCGEQKCPEHVCPTCVKPTCPESEQPSSIWKYTSVLLVIILIIMVFVMIFKSSGTKSNVKNLAKLN